MMRWTCFGLAIVLALPGSLTGQSDSATRRQDGTLQETVRQDVQRATWRLEAIHYGKWFTGVGAVALTWLGAREHERSADAWSDLLAVCHVNSADCAVDATGRYLNAATEQHYQRSQRFDERARLRLLAGQAALLLTIGLFVLDLPHRKDGPENIPVAPLEISADPGSGTARLGLRLTF
jgi:hypothetical protein